MIKKLLATIPLCLMLVLPMSPVMVGAATKDIVCGQLDQSGTGVQCDQTKNDSIVNTTLGKIVSFLIYVAGAAAVIVIVIAGLMYVLSTGDPNNTKRAKDAILYAVIGLVVAIIARLIVDFVLTRIA